MIALFNALPTFCPQGGAALTYSTPDARREANNGISQQCRCGCQYARINTAPLLNMADREGSDLSRYAKR